MCCKYVGSKSEQLQRDIIAQNRVWRTRLNPTRLSVRGPYFQCVCPTINMRATLTKLVGSTRFWPRRVCVRPMSIRTYTRFGTSKLARLKIIDSALLEINKSATNWPVTSPSAVLCLVIGNALREGCYYNDPTAGLRCVPTKALYLG